MLAKLSLKYGTYEASLQTHEKLLKVPYWFPWNGSYCTKREAKKKHFYRSLYIWVCEHVFKEENLTQMFRNFPKYVERAGPAGRWGGRGVNWAAKRARAALTPGSSSCARIRPAFSRFTTPYCMWRGREPCTRQPARSEVIPGILGIDGPNHYKDTKP
jgi:hypothetical protein